MDKKSLSERDICTKFIRPALVEAGWDAMSQIQEEVTITKGRITVRGKLVSRGKAKRADYVLYYKSKILIAIVEPKNNNHFRGRYLASHRLRRVVGCAFRFFVKW